MDFIKKLLGFFGSPIARLEKPTSRANPKASDLLLSKFLRPQDLIKFERCDYWDPLLGRPLLQVLHEAVSSGRLVRASLEGCLDYTLTVADLKVVLAQQGLKKSGRKAELLARLIEADPVAASRLVENKQIFTCSDSEQVRLQAFLEQEKRIRREIEHASMAALRNHRFLDAARMVVDYESQQVFARGVGLPWTPSYASTLAAKIEQIFNSNFPSILTNVPIEARESIRVGAAMLELWSRPEAELSIDDLGSAVTLAPEAAPRTLLSYVQHRAKLKDYQTLSRRGKVRILGTVDNSTCAHCYSKQERVFSLTRVPEIPLAKCTSNVGCRCTLVSADA